ncbi:uncharacterized protein LOC121381998 [Gigantopelta aegis]|uniref:uncharacterized protein LOC121381998 n=1 Tax=Gigantopelta aegis TaxID=1735272 RepID=UPI001B888591|nr:uncharacterized protein LOC121381998 [Gigantopelta aegis]XP_041367397.1 uncharacterized protein LOC121381998 [Gigantopelta aegis]
MKMTSNTQKRSVVTRGFKRSVLENPATVASLDSLTRSQFESLKTKMPSVQSSASPSSASTRTPRERIAEWRKQLENTHWIQCDNEDCMKWRRVTEAEVTSVTEESKWFCFMNNDEQFRSCDVPEENTRWYDNTAKKLGLVYIKSILKEGTLVLAKFPGYCKWPALITQDPDNNLFVTFTSPGEPYTYHVEFLGKSHSHGWVKASSVEIFGKAVLQKERVKTETCTQWKRRSGLQKKALTLKQNAGKQTYRKSETVQYAMEEARHLQLMSVSERLVRCEYLPNQGYQSYWAKNHAQTSTHDSVNEESRCKHDLSLCSETLNINKLKPNVETEKGYHAEIFHHINNLKPQDQRQRTNRKSLKINTSAEQYEAESPVIQSLNFSDADGVNVQLDFSSNSLADHSKEEKFVLDVEMYKRNERAFDHDVYRFMKRNDVKISRPPIWHKTPVTLFQLFLAVHERGGYKKVCSTRSWTSVYREVSEVCTASTSHYSYGSIAKRYYKKNLYPYELYIKGKDYSKYIKLAKPKISKKKSKAKTHTANSLIRLAPTMEQLQAVNIGENCLFDELNDLDSEKSLDLMELLGNLEQEGTLCCLEEDVAIGQSKLGIDITFCNESPLPKQIPNIVEADTFSEFGTFVQQGQHSGEEAQVPDTSIFSLNSNDEDKFLYEMQALQKELYEQIDNL